MSSEWLVHDGEVIPSVLVLSHDEQLDRLRAECPDAMDRALVAGDLIYDQLTASRPLRATYRRALGLSREQRLVIVSSTWGQESLLGTHPQLAQRLAENLPVDEFRVAVALHPNVWFGHSRWQVSQWLASCRRLGVTVLDDMDEWRTAVVAADLMVGDHGSIPFYSTALGNPILLAAAPAHTVAPDSAIHKLLAVAPRLDPAADLATQVRQAIADHEPRRYARIATLTTSVPGRAAALLRAAIYRLLDLPEQDTPAEPTLPPMPARALRHADAHLTYVEAVGRHTAKVTRFPAERLRTDTGVPRGAHLATDVTAARHRWLDLADVVVGVEGARTAEWISDTLGRLPGCALAAAPESGREWLLGDRAGNQLRFTADAPAGHLFASVAYQVLGTGGKLADLHGTWLVRAGAEEHRVTATPDR